MGRTCHMCGGHSKDYDETRLKRCSGCQKVFYCSMECQKYDWVRHIFDCNPRRPINTSDHLALAVKRNLLPEDPQTCEDFGFDRVLAPEDKSKLLGLYIGLIEVLKIPPKTIHRWQTKGVLIEEIKAAYSQLPEESRGGYFPWFLQHENVFADTGKQLPKETMEDHGAFMLLRAWRFVGGGQNDSVEQIRAAIARKSPGEQECLTLYQLLLSRWHPPPEFEIWVKFGFAAYTNQEGEMFLGTNYQILIHKCSFKEFYDAYRNRGLLNLFHSKGLLLDANRHLGDILGGTAGCYKSVWYLKQFTQDRVDESTGVIPAVAADYGFMNCRDASERRQLRRVYKAFFETHEGDPLALHEAAVEGNLHEFLSQTVEGLRDPKFRRLLINSYPLPDM